MREVIDATLSVSPCGFWERSHHIPGALNPSVAQWHRNVMMSWHPRASADLLFGWFNGDGGRAAAGANANNSSGSSPFSHTLTKFGMDRAELPFSAMASTPQLKKSEARMLVMNNGDDLVVAYMGKLKVSSTEGEEEVWLRCQCYSKARVAVQSTGGSKVQFSRHFCASESPQKVYYM